MKTIEIAGTPTASGRAGVDTSVELHEISRSYERRPALIRLTIAVRAGEILLLRGSNGAGKSTLLRILATVLAPTSGAGKVLGLDLHRNRSEIRRRIEYVAHSTRLYEDLTPRENLAFVAKMWGLADPDIERALEGVGLHTVADLRVAAFSQGMRQRLALARTLIRQADLLLLDEPFAALDSAARSSLETILGDVQARGGTVILVSHDHYADSLASRTIDLAHGRIVADSAVDAGATA